jgi:hypothetical protein
MRFLNIFYDGFQSERITARRGCAYDAVKLVENVERDDIVPRVVWDWNGFVDQLCGGGFGDAAYPDLRPREMLAQEAVLRLVTHSCRALPRPGRARVLMVLGIWFYHYRNLR